MKEVRKNTETLDSLKREIEEKQNKIRSMKRTDSEVNLILVQDKINSDNISDVKEVIKACYDYIAQHRAMLKSNNALFGLD